MKHTITIIAALALCATVLLSFAGCSANGTGTSSSSAQSTAAATEAVTEKSVENATVANAGDGKKVYFAGPMFNQAEKDFNLKMTKVLEDNGYEVFLPQRDGIEAALLEGKSEDELVEMIFKLDESRVKEADIIFMNLDGRVPDEGACVELGIAFAEGKRCYGFKTDTRAAERSLDLNPMISGCMTKIFSNFDGDKLIEEINSYLSENKL